MRNASMKVLKNLVCCAAFICLMFVLAMPAHAASKADELLQLVNAERAQEVAKVASHTRPDGTNCFTVLEEYGVSDTATGENAAWGETTPEKVVADWMALEGHRVNIMDPAAKYMCLGYNYDANSQWGHNWIQIFAK